MLTKIWDFIKKHDIISFILLIILFLCVRSSMLGNYKVPTASMRPTIYEGDYFFANKLAYRLKIPFTKTALFSWSVPKRGDIIAFKFPRDEKIDFTKRVIALPGETFEIKNGELFINGKQIKKILMKSDDDYDFYSEDLMGFKHMVQYKKKYKTLFDNYNKDNMSKITIPQKCLFVMGDNRDHSDDSRYWGFVPLENVEGKLVLRWFSLDPESYKPLFNRIGLIE